MLVRARRPVGAIAIAAALAGVSLFVAPARERGQRRRVPQQFGHTVRIRQGVHQRRRR